MKNIIRRIFPFFITIILWYLADPKWNPFGVLVIIPIFYYMITSVEYWFPFSIYMLFMLDFNTGTKFLFTGSFLLISAANNFLGFLGKDKGLDLKAFMMFLGLIILPFGIFTILNSNRMFLAAVNVLWIFGWVAILYWPFVLLFKRIEDDR